VISVHYWRIFEIEIRIEDVVLAKIYSTRNALLNGFELKYALQQFVLPSSPNFDHAESICSRIFNLCKFITVILKTR